MKPVKEGKGYSAVWERDREHRQFQSFNLFTLSKSFLELEVLGTLPREKTKTETLFNRALRL
ncbi:hypothetical protein CIPAW_09G000200 [Carya illinoinensis]|uniref:Uncharacterized protein n=1 Tax=Carya illinoinensis TaxID=32201 RepID=A0A8T1PFD1_CARIL|nr:hypothetical protein CIPAW_09G000200 [Carya illinoinensis]